MTDMIRADLVHSPRRDTIIAQHMLERRLPHLSQAVEVQITRTLSSSAMGHGLWIEKVIGVIDRSCIQALGPMKLPEAYTTAY